MTDKLLNLVSQGEIAITGAKPKLPTTIPNLIDNMLDVYRIPLKYLYYNNENGRISTYIKRKSEMIIPHSDEGGPEYNDMIAGFIEEDNSGALKKTKKSIREKGQQIYGYVLKDGRIIDGNRRFTALRQIEREIGTTQYFEAVILPFTYDARADRAQIKRLELSIQMGTEEKLQYDSVDLAVDAYNTIVQDGLMTAGDYAHETNVKVKEIRDRIETVELMHDFLRFINSSEDAYHIIKDAKIYTPLYDLTKKFSRTFPNKGPKYEQTKNTAFGLLGKLISTGGDTVDGVRSYIKDVVTAPVNAEYNGQVEDDIDELRDKLEASPIDSATELKKRLEEATPQLRNLTGSYNTIVNRQNRGKNIDNFISDVQESLNTLRDMQRGDGLTGNLHFNNFSKDEISSIRELLVQINIVSADLIEVYEDEL